MEQFHCPNVQASTGLSAGEHTEPLTSKLLIVTRWGKLQHNLTAAAAILVCAAAAYTLYTACQPVAAIRRAAHQTPIPKFKDEPPQPPICIYPIWPAEQTK